MAFRFLEHTADVRVECGAPTFEGLLEEAACALYATALTRTVDGHAVMRAFVLPPGPHEERLIRWLQELLFLLDVEHFVAVRFGLLPMDDGGLSARTYGYLCSEEDRAVEVKSATYHDLEIEHSEAGWTARIVFDV